ncbi:type II secretion system protein [Massilia horti]|uniref:Prepilin-type N-terminal cleavage/methylation domain-containing protein n=1 Tax=Massilia horti TaxID=2562153 RepID=A0A4Y9T6H8_9BURK|nr:prepilin-type N-terminal cleavage/methylation domain-containing protein [Massilia horti]TFW36184.1 prepilin-type N-terminal cleavage/methylation domain-containing protein [Massilia horti]
MASHTGAGRRGFTLIELLVVLAILALLMTVAVPRYFHSIDQSKETILKENLRITRSAIDSFYGDNGRYPQSLDELVERGYLRSLPVDPVTESVATWIVVPAADGKGVFDLHSGAAGTARSGIALQYL